MTTDKIDVLAVMDSAWVNAESQAKSDEMRKARAAVAELIEAAREELEVGFNAAPTPTRRRLSAALTHVRGGVA